MRSCGSVCGVGVGWGCVGVMSVGCRGVVVVSFGLLVIGVGIVLCGMVEEIVVFGWSVD